MASALKDWWRKFMGVSFVENGGALYERTN